jgi:hypothetical protein
MINIKATISIFGFFELPEMTEILTYEFCDGSVTVLKVEVQI